MIRMVAVALALAWAPVALAEPTYLACEIMSGGKSRAYQFALDEDHQQAVVSAPSGNQLKKDAAFTPSTVTISDRETTWTISRTSLAVTRVVVIGSDRWDETGQCKIAPVPANRAF